jgi:hypothetical protein
MPSDGNVSIRGESKAEENFYLSEGKKNKKKRSGDVPLPLALARATVLQRSAVLQRSVEIQTSIWIKTKRSKMPLSLTLKLQTLKTGFKLRTRLCLENEGPR